MKHLCVLNYSFRPIGSLRKNENFISLKWWKGQAKKMSETKREEKEYRPKKLNSERHISVAFNIFCSIVFFSLTIYAKPFERKNWLRNPGCKHNGKWGSWIQKKWSLNNGWTENRTRVKINDLYNSYSLFTIFHFAASIINFNYILIIRFEMNSMVRIKLIGCKHTDCSLYNCIIQ